MTDMSDNLTGMVAKLGINKIERHIFLCCDQTKPKCCDKSLSLESWKYLKKRLTELQLTGAGVLVLIAYHSLIQAMRIGEISAIAPFRYSVVLWAMILGYLVFGGVPSASTIIGSMIVIAAGLYTLHRERVTARRA